MIWTFVLTAVIVIPVIGLLWYIVRRFRDVPGNDAPYKPDWSESTSLEVVWWAIPIVIVGILSVVTAKDTFALTRPPEKLSTKPVTIQVTSLNWKWLFQYPGQKVATVNYCYIPTNQAVQFVLTSDAPMNSFWVPRLGGQEYTMPGMAMRLWLQADKPDVYFGSGANFTGHGFAHMRFHVVAVPRAQFDNWVKQVKSSSPPLTELGLTELRKPGLTGQLTYSSYPPNSFTKMIMKDGGMYMAHDRGILDTTTF